MPNPKGLPQLIPVKSSNIQAIGYDPETSDLFVQFLVRGKPKAQGPVYKFTNVPDGVFSRFQKAASAGTYFWMHIRGQFRYYVWTGSAWRAQRKKG